MHIKILLGLLSTFDFTPSHLFIKLLFRESSGIYLNLRNAFTFISLEERSMRECVLKVNRVYCDAT